MRDDMEIHYYDYKSRKFSFRIPDCNITDPENRKYRFHIVVYEENAPYFHVNFRLHEDDMDQAIPEVHRKIQKYVDNQGK